MGACGSTEERQRQQQSKTNVIEDPKESQRQQRQEQLAVSRMLVLWLVEPTPSRQVNAPAIETAQELAHRLANELDIDEVFWPLVSVEFSDVVLDPSTTLEQAGIDMVRGCMSVRPEHIEQEAKIKLLGMEAAKEAAATAVADEEAAARQGPVISKLALNGNAGMLRKLLANDTRGINYRDKQGRSPLWICIAAASRDTEAIKVLVEFEADVNQANFYGRTPLGTAAHYGNEEAATVLLSAKADPNPVPDQGGYTPLCMAKRLGHWRMAELLVKAGAQK